MRVVLNSRLMYYQLLHARSAFFQSFSLIAEFQIELGLDAFVPASDFGNFHFQHCL